MKFRVFFTNKKKSTNLRFFGNTKTLKSSLIKSKSMIKTFFVWKKPTKTIFNKPFTSICFQKNFKFFC